MKVAASAFLVMIALTLGTVRAESPRTEIESGIKPIEIHANSPDRAVKTWWDIQDANRAFEKSVCPELAPRSPRRIHAEAILRGEILSAAKRIDCSTEAYERSIVRVDIQSDTLAFVYATIKNVTAPDANATLSPKDKSDKESGEDIKYQLERDGASEDWKISQIFGRNAFATALSTKWSPLYHSRGPNGHIYVDEYSQ
ncbi:hypothetical protein KVP10_08385 [Candidimonas humi]|uniref:Uncharacterized protein n=1 Tax=Candidimonas humi TaxID=683355 RepID=A0ABV8NUK3_9BURK|nr:hypothetical protein [Candidimonas humi]MBV6304903.1 hypothetical protein [Candidimonas humi]